MIGQIHAMCQDWGAAKRRIWMGTIKGGDPDGWPARTILGKIHEEAEGASSTVSRQFFAEVMTGNELDIAIALQGAVYEDYCLAMNHYVFTGKFEQKLLRYGELIGRSVGSKTYWVDIHGLHKFLKGRLSRLEVA